MRILSTFLLLLAFFVVFTVYSFISNTSVENEAKDLVEKDIVILNASQNLATSSSVRLSAALSYVLTGEESYIEIFNTYRQLAEDNNAIVEKYIQSEERDELVATAREWSDIVANNVFAVYQAGDIEQARANLTDATSLVTKVRTGYEAMATDRAVAIEQAGTDMVSSSSTNKIIGVIVSLIVTALGVIIALTTARTISAPVSLVASRMEDLAHGDLSQAPLTIKRNDEIGTLVVAANEMNTKLQATINSIYHVSNTVAASSEELAQSSNEVKSGVEQVAHTMQELAAGTETQASTAGDLSETMRMFTESIQEITNEGTALKTYSANVEQLTESGKSLMSSSTNQMSMINEIMLDSVKKVEELNTQSDEISKLVSVIDAISNQTNLLALNAAIEAARAGEHGKGFAVVADEVRKLAEQVQSSVAEISTIVNRIQSDTGNVTKSLQDGYQEVKKGTLQIHDTGTTFNSISNAVVSMIASIDTISSNLTTVLTRTEGIGASIDDIASISQESAAGIEQTTATTQQSASTLEEVVHSANNLAGLAQQLNNEMQQFKL